MEKGFTQEKLAELLGLSAQAVSRWENDQAYPDVSLLPGLAMLFDTSIDEIVGMESLRREEKLHELISGAYTLAAQGEYARAEAQIREGLRLYPGNSGLLMALSETLAHRSGDPEALREAVRAAERVLENGDISMKARSTTMVNLMFLYMRAGLEEQAEALVKELPHVWESREIVFPETRDGAEYRQALRDAVEKTLVFLCRKVDAAGCRRIGETPEYVQKGVDFRPDRSAGEMLKTLGAFLEEQPPEK